MAVDAGKTCCANQAGTQRTTGVSVRLSRTSFRRKTQVGHINLVSLLPHAHQAVLRLDVSMDDIVGMDILQTTKELVDEHQDCLERKFATAEIEQVFQTRTQEVEYHGVIFALGHIGVHSWNTGTTRKRSVDISFTFEEGRIDGDVFKFDGNLLTGVDMGSLSAVSESQEATVARRIRDYLCRQRRNCHHRSSLAADTYRRRVNPDVDELLV